MAEKVYFGVPGNIQEIPAPKSGMAFLSNVDYEETELVSGGRSIYRAPTAYKTFNMTWGSNSDRLRHLIDLYNGQFGPGPFYITDPTAHSENVLPSRWANSWQLAHQANGWCRPVVNIETAPTAPMPTVARTNRAVVFTQAISGASVKTSGVVRTRLIRVPGKPYFLSAAGSATGGAGIYYRTYSNSTNAWSAPTLFSTLTGSATQIVTAGDTTTTMIELDLYLPLGSTLTLRGMALGTVDHSVIQNVLRTNLATNPSFETTSGTVNVRTNLATNPSVEVDTTGYTAARVTLEASADWAAVGTKSLKTISTGVSVDAYATIGGDGGAFRLGLQAGKTYTVSATVNTPVALTGESTGARRIYFFYRNAAGSYVSVLSPQGPVTGSARVSVTATIPADATEAFIRLYNASPTLGDVVYWDAIMVEESSVLGAYFDGSTPAAGDFTYVWSGAENASTSFARGVGVASVSGGNLYPFQSAEWSTKTGKKSVRLRPFNVSGSNSTSMLVSGITFTPGKTYTVFATRRLAAPLTGALNSTYAGTVSLVQTGAAHITSPTLANVAGEGQVKWTFTVDPATTATTLRLGHGGAEGSGDVWWDDLLVTEGNHTGTYFDGSTPDSTSQDRYYRWTGPADASSSVMTDQIPTDWMASGRGVGPVQFSGAADGELVSSTIDRIGLSLDFTEVQNVESPML